ncbi:DUF3080 family protein [Aliamphritea spongicola]
MACSPRSDSDTTTEHFARRHARVPQRLPRPVQRKGQWQQYRQALRRHTAAWQDILGQCDMMPDGTR